MPRYRVENPRNERAITWKSYDRGTGVLSYQIGSISVGSEFDGIVVGTHIMSGDRVVQVGVVYTRMKWLKEIPVIVDPPDDPPDDPPVEEPPSGAPPDLRRLRVWGDPIMIAYGYDINIVSQQHNTLSNWQNLKTFNFATNVWGAVSNSLRIPRADIDRLRAMQIPDSVTYQNGTTILYSQKQKMNWLCGDKGKIYLQAQEWETLPEIKWGTTAIGGNFVQVERYETMRLPDPADGTRMVTLEMAKLRGFRKTDWSRSLPELISEGLVHRCYCVYSGNRFGDSPRGVVYSPFWSPLDWRFSGSPQSDALWIPTAWMY